MVILLPTYGTMAMRLETSRQKHRGMKICGGAGRREEKKRAAGRKERQNATRHVEATRLQRGYASVRLQVAGVNKNS